jgi:hypothetical protein
MSGFIRYAAGELLFLPLRLLSAYADRSVVSPPSSVEAAGVDAADLYNESGNP